MTETIIGLLAIGIGALLCFAGYRVARILIPIWGFFAGFLMGASGVSDALNNEFLGTTLGIVVGLILGLVFALFSYFFFSLAIVLLGASLGYWLGTSFMAMIGFEKGFLTAVVGISLGVVLAIVAIIINAPKYYLIITTALAGAAAVFGGILIMFGQINIESLSYLKTTQVNIADYWVVLSAILAGVGVFYQIYSNREYELEKWGTPFAEQKTDNIKTTP